MRWCIRFIGIFLLVLMSLVQGILIIGPKRIYAGRQCSIVISNFLDTKVDLSLSLEGSNNPAKLPTKIVNVRSNSNQYVAFDVPEGLLRGEYRFAITGIERFSFYEDVPVMLERNPTYGLIQLDKPVYKPGDKVNFRVIMLDSELKPPKNLTNVAIKIKTQTGFTVALWRAVLFKIGVFENSFLIAPAPTLGTYEIVVESDDVEFAHKTFEVKEYVLSGLIVNAFPTRVPLQVHQGVDLTVSATDVFGKPISGIVDLTLFEKDSLMNVKATHNVHGEAKLTIRFDTKLNIYEDFHEIHLNYTFTEQYTNRTIANSMPITIFKTMYRAILVKESPEFFPGYPFIATIGLEYHDGSPATNVKCIVRVDGTEEDEHERISDENGKIPLRIAPVASDVNIKITVSVGEQNLLEEEINKAMSNTNAYIKIVFKSDVQINKPIKLLITHRKEVKFFIYYVLAKGNVIDQGYKKNDHRKSSSKLDINYLTSMVPKARLFVATVSDDTVIYDMKDIVFRGLSNNFDMKVDNEEVKSGEMIHLRMMGCPDCYVALAAYDESLIQHGSTHDLHWSDVQKLYDKFYEFEENEFDIFQSIGLFAKLSGKLILSEASSTAARKGQEQVSKLIPYRTNFAESFLWMNTRINKDERQTIIQQVPDSTTAWYLTGFSMDPIYGLGIVKKPLRFITTKAFYIVDHLPYSIKQDEVVALQFTLFNNLPEAQSTQITLFNEQNHFEFMEPNSDKTSTKNLLIHQSVSVPITFLVKAKKLGEMVVRLKAMNLRETDGIEKVIRVMPKNVVHHGSKTIIFAKTHYDSFDSSISLDVNKYAEAGSVKIYFIIEPNLLANVMDNLDNLISVPTGSGESNMIWFVPNVAVLDYLSTTAPNHELIARTKKQLGLGYQNQLKYRLKDGSFKDFDRSKSSIFLTAFVAKSMQTASKYLAEIDGQMVNQAFDWLASQQKDDGRFEEIGPIVLQDMQTKSRHNIALTSYVLSAFLENLNTRHSHSSVIKKGIDYILRHTDKIGDALDLAIATYALTLYDSKSEVLTSLQQYLIGNATTTDEYLYWNRESHSIETTSYALLALLQKEDYMHNGVLVMNWLVNQRFRTGSFPRTQDTFVGLKALTKLAEVISTSNNDYKVHLMIPRKGSSFIKTFIITSKDINAQIFEEVPDDSRTAHIKVEGKGLALLTFQYEYSLALRNHRKGFNISLEKLTTISNRELKMRVCATFIPKLTYTLSNMVLVEVTFPSGYVVDNNPISSPTTITQIEKIEIRFGATSVVVYYANMGTETNCFTITAKRRFEVTLRRPAYVVVQDYYNSKLNAIEVYNTVLDE